MRTTKKAAALTTASKNNQHSRVYHSPLGRSSGNLREQLGVLLLYLQTPLSPDNRKTCWALFESRLRQYVDLKICGGAL